MPTPLLLPPTLPSASRGPLRRNVSEPCRKSVRSVCFVRVVVFLMILAAVVVVVLLGLGLVGSGDAGTFLREEWCWGISERKEIGGRSRGGEGIRSKKQCE